MLIFYEKEGYFKKIVLSLLTHSRDQHQQQENSS